jgi:hypothetical protein
VAARRQQPCQTQRVRACSLCRCRCRCRCPAAGTTQQLRFDRGPHGKPHLQLASVAAADRQVAAQLQFNLAHTHSMIGEAQPVLLAGWAALLLLLLLLLPPAAASSRREAMHTGLLLCASHTHARSVTWGALWRWLVPRRVCCVPQWAGSGAGPGAPAARHQQGRGGARPALVSPAGGGAAARCALGVRDGSERNAASSAGGRQLSRAHARTHARAHCQPPHTHMRTQA